MGIKHAFPSYMASDSTRGLDDNLWLTYDNNCFPKFWQERCCYYFFFSEFFTPALAVGFHRILRDSKSIQVSRTFLGILADLSNGVLWMVSTRPLICKSSNRCNNSLVIVPSASVAIGIVYFSSLLNVLIWLELLLLCMIFYLSLYSDFFFFLF